MAVVVNDRDLQLEATIPRTLDVTMAPNIVVGQDNVEGLGLIIEGTKQVYIAATSQVFQIAKSGTISPATITLTAYVKNITGTPTLTIAPGGGTMSVTPTLTGGIFTFAAADMTTDAVTLRLSITEGITVYKDDFTFVKVREGSDSVVGFLTNESCTLPGDALGNITNWGGASGKFRVFSGITDVTAACTFTIATGGNPDNLTYSLVSTGTNAGDYSVTGNWPSAADATSLTMQATFGSTVLQKVFSLTRAKSGQNGVQGANAATVYLFQRTSTSTAPGLPTADILYTFATGIASGITGGWTQSMPTAGGPYRWMTTATALGTGTTDTIVSTEWAPVANVGTDGFTTAVVYLYQRSATTPSVPSTTVTFTFATGVATGQNNGWQQSIPAGTNPVYVTTATASSQGATDTIGTAEWATPVVLSQNGNAGQRGSMTFYVGLTGTNHVWDNTVATTAASVQGGPILNDVVTEYNNSQSYSETRFWTGSAWVVINAVVDGNLLVSGTVGTNALVANSVTATKIDSRGLTIKDANGNVIFDAGTTPGADLATTYGFNPTFSAWTGIYPDGWGIWLGSPPTKDTGRALNNSPWVVNYVCPGGSDMGATRVYGFVNSPMPAGTLIHGSFNIYMVTNNGGGPPGYLVRLYTNGGLTTYVDTKVPIPNQAVTGWQRIPFIAGAGNSNIFAIRIYQMASWSGFTGSSAAAGNSMSFGPFWFDAMERIDSGNASVYIADAAIDSAQIASLDAGQINAASLSAITATIGTLRTTNTGQRVEIQDNKIRVYDSSNVLRVKIGDLT